MLASRSASVAALGRTARVPLTAQRSAAASFLQRRNHGGTPCGSGACGVPSNDCAAKDTGIWDSCKSDIAFKPNTSGWGYNANYSSGFDRIFGKKDKTAVSAQQQQTANEEAAAGGSR